MVLGEGEEFGAHPEPEGMKILLSLDGSPTSESALPVALAMARRLQAEVLLVRVGDLGAGKSLGAQPSIIAGRKHEQEELRTYLEAQQKVCQGVESRFRVLSGEPWEALVKVATKEECDLIVMASSGRTGVSRWLLGSVAESVVRQSPCPVLLVRAAPGGADFRRVLAPVDGSKPSLAALERLSPFLSEGAEVTLLRVGDAAPEPIPVPGATVTPRALPGSPAEVILGLANDEKPDLIVMSTRGRSTLSRLLVGSCTEKVMHQARCPLLIFPPVRP